MDLPYETSGRFSMLAVKHCARLFGRILRGYVWADLEGPFWQDCSLTVTQELRVLVGL